MATTIVMNEKEAKGKEEEGFTGVNRPFQSMA